MHSSIIAAWADCLYERALERVSFAILLKRRDEAISKSVGEADVFGISANLPDHTTTRKGTRKDVEEPWLEQPTFSELEFDQRKLPKLNECKDYRENETRSASEDVLPNRRLAGDKWTLWRYDLRRRSPRIPV